MKTKNWYAWYDHQPPQPYDPNLRVTGICCASPDVELRLVPGDVGVVPEPDLFVLDLLLTDPHAEDESVEHKVRWEGDVGPDFKRVRIQGAATADIDVEFPE